MRFFDPVPLTPFLAWAEQRQAQIVRELNARPAISDRRTSRNMRDGRAGPGQSCGSPLERLVADLGWPIESGLRRLHRWRHESLTGTAERLAIETALRHAGVDFEAIYPDLPAARKQRSAGRCDECGEPLLWRAPLCNFCVSDNEFNARHARFVEKWLARCTVNDNGCWIWPGAKFRAGYGNVSVLNQDGTRRNAGLHRVIYEYKVGPIPKGLVLDHLPFCRTPECCNPEHLEPVTQRENLLRGDTIPAHNAAKTHCPRGHEYTAENTWTSARGQRSCITCLRDGSLLKYRTKAGIPLDRPVARRPVPACIGEQREADEARMATAA